MRSGMGEITTETQRTQRLFLRLKGDNPYLSVISVPRAKRVVDNGMWDLGWGICDLRYEMGDVR